MQSSRHVTILMGVRDGVAHLGAQLDSLVVQAHADWTLIASDDGSRDGSRAVIDGFAAARPGGQVRRVDGPGQGFAANYLSMLARIAPAPGWVAFADQDDVWLPDRLSRGLASLAPLDPSTPALYCSRTWVTADGLADRRLSAPRPRPPSFRNALVQNIAAGNTILLNPAAAALMAATAAQVPGVVAHDWWAYLLVSGAGGRIVHDDTPTVLYRQHGGNAIGANDDWTARWRRLAQVLRGTYARWNDVNAAALDACLPHLSPESRQVFAGWQAMRGARPMPRRLWRLAGLRLYRQSAASMAVLWLAALIGRV